MIEFLNRSIYLILKLLIYECRVKCSFIIPGYNYRWTHFYTSEDVKDAAVQKTLDVIFKISCASAENISRYLYAVGDNPETRLDRRFY